MRKFILAISIIFCAFYTSAQENRPKLKIGANAGYATYTFDNLKSANDAVINQLPFDAEVIDDFPARFYFGGYALLKIADWYSVGPAYEFHSTGSRVGAKDYSGSYHFDQILSSHQLGLENELLVTKGLKPAVFIDVTGGVNFSAWKMEEELEVDKEVISSDKSEFSAVKPFVKPAVKISYPAYSNIKITGSAGYLFDVGGKYHLSGNKDYKSIQKIPWSGFRISLGIEFNME